MVDHQIIFRKASFCAFLTVTVVAAGCSGASAGRYGFPGVIKYDGKDAAMADLTFTPDSDKGTKGPGAFVKAKDGKFTVEAANGPAKGAYIVDVTIYDGKSTSAKDSRGQKVAGPLQKKVEIPPAKNVLELNFAADDPADKPAVKQSDSTRRKG